MYKLIIGNKNYSSWSLRPWVLLKELDIPFEEELKPFINGGSWAEYRSFSPTGTVPVLIDTAIDAEEGESKVTVWDSLSIVEYIAESHPQAWPANPIAKAWARSITAEMHAGFFAIRNQCTMTVGQTIKLHKMTPELEKDIARIDEIWTEGLDKFGGQYLAGNTFTIADAFYAPVAFRVKTYGLPLSEKAQAYVDRILNLESMQQWKTAGIAETWREPAHEKEATDTGVIIEDLRASYSLIIY